MIIHEYPYIVKCWLLLLIMIIYFIIVGKREFGYGHGFPTGFHFPRVVEYKMGPNQIVEGRRKSPKIEGNWRSWTSKWISIKKII